MGFRKPMDYSSVHHQIYMSGVELASPYNDGYIAWEIKQDLYRLKWLIDAILDASEKFTGEDEFLKEHSEKEILRILQR